MLVADDRLLHQRNPVPVIQLQGSCIPDDTAAAAAMCSKAYVALCRRPGPQTALMLSYAMCPSILAATKQLGSAQQHMQHML